MNKNNIRLLVACVQSSFIHNKTRILIAALSLLRFFRTSALYDFVVTRNHRYSIFFLYYYDSHAEISSDLTAL